MTPDGMKTINKLKVENKNLTMCARSSKSSNLSPIMYEKINNIYDVCRRLLQMNYYEQDYKVAAP